MTTVRVTLEADGSLKAAEAGGHAGTELRGGNIACAAVTVLLRTTLGVLASAGDADPDSALFVDATTPGRGFLAFRITGRSGADKPVLRYAARFLLEGIASLEREFPAEVKLLAETACGPNEQRKDLEE